jgi:phospho-N-acetylmuramoyl-pentapeptide-transferase
MPRVLIGSITAAMLLIFLGPKFIGWLRANEVGQFVRARGLIPEGHAQKHGTPTMGGLLILLATSLPFVIPRRGAPRRWPCSSRRWPAGRWASWTTS